MQGLDVRRNAYHDKKNLRNETLKGIKFPDQD